MVALDTNIVIEFLRGNKKITDKVLNFASVCLPVTVCGELLFGAINSGKNINIEKTRDFINNCYVLNITTEAAERYSVIRNDLKKKGKPIPENDIWIAAVCSVNSVMLFSNDKHFNNIPDNFLMKI